MRKSYIISLLLRCFLRLACKLASLLFIGLPSLLKGRLPAAADLGCDRLFVFFSGAEDCSTSVIFVCVSAVAETC